MSIRLEKSRIPQHLLKYFETDFCSSCYVCHTIQFLREIRRVLRKDGVVFWNIGDSYYANRAENGLEWGDGKLSKAHSTRSGGKSHDTLKPKDLCLIPFRVAIAAQEDGWYVRSDIIWSKPNPMPESVTDRPTNSHEYIFMFTKSARYYWDADAVREVANYDGRNDTIMKPSGKYSDRNIRNDGANPNSVHQRGAERWPNQVNGQPGRNIRSVWEFPTQPFSDWGFDYEHADYVGDDGKPYILSEDCPVHWRHPEKGIQRRDACDEQSNHQPLGKVDSTNGLAQAPEAEFASTHSPDEPELIVANSDEHIPESKHAHKTSSLEKAEPQMSGHIEGTQRIPASSLGCESQKYAPSAIEHSKQNHKRDPALETNPPCNSSEKTGDHTDGKLKQPSLSGLDQHIDGSNTEAGLSSNEKELNPLAGTLFHNARKSYSNYKCSCKISQVSHFAVFPEKLPETCIKASTPEVGCCAECGSPWERITETKQYPRHSTEPHDLATDGNGANQGKHAKPTETKTTGWHPTCKCNADKVPSTVLDCFSGSGTTLWVAKKLNRKAIGFEISEEYCKLAAKRCKQQVML